MLVFRRRAFSRIDPKTSTKRLRSSWSGLMCALAYRNKRTSTLALYHRAKTLARGVKITSIIQTPDCRPYMEWLGRVADARVSVYVRDSGRVYRYPRIGSEGREMRLICWTQHSRQPPYSLLLSKRTRVHYCRRCERVTFGSLDRIQHAALCSKRNANAYNWNRKSMLALQKSKVTPRKENKKTRLKFLPGRAASSTVNVQRRIENLGIRGYAHLFQTNGTMVCIDSEASLARSRSAKTDLVEYSSNFTFCNVHNLINIAVAYRICGQKRTRVHIFWVDEEAETPRRVVTSLVKFLNALSAVNYKRMCSGPFKELLSRLDAMEDGNACNGFLCRQVQSARRSLLQYLRHLLCVGYNFGAYDAQLLRRYGFLDILKEQDEMNQLTILKRGTKYMLIATTRLRFVDLLSYSPMKCSLRKFYDTFLLEEGKQQQQQQVEAGQGKGIFPYCYVRSAKQLRDSIDRIDYHHFDDVLQGGNSLNRAYSDYCRLRRLGHDEKTTLKMMGNMRKRPLSGRSLMSHLRVQWRRAGLKTVKDLMQSYTENDVTPLYASVIRFLQSFQILQLGDMLHSYVSLAQASYTYFMNSCSSSRHFSGLTPDLYASFRSYLCGGPSVAYNRYLRCGESRCREEHLPQQEAELISSIYCLDVTSHYSRIAAKF